MEKVMVQDKATGNQDKEKGSRESTGEKERKAARGPKWVKRIQAKEMAIAGLDKKIKKARQKLADLEEKKRTKLAELEEVKQKAADEREKVKQRMEALAAKAKDEFGNLFESEV